VPFRSVPFRSEPFRSEPFRSRGISVWGHCGHDISVHKRLLTFGFLNDCRQAKCHSSCCFINSLVRSHGCDQIWIENGPDRIDSERIGQTETVRSNQPDRKAAYPSTYSLLFLTMQGVMNVQIILILLLKSFENEKDFWFGIQKLSFKTAAEKLFQLYLLTRVKDSALLIRSNEKFSY